MFHSAASISKMADRYFLLATLALTLTQLSRARVTLTVNEESNDLVPTLHSSRGVTVSAESCMRDCYGPTWVFSTPPSTAVRLTGFLQREYCPLRTCSLSYRLSAQYPVNGVTLSVTITRMDDGDRLRADLVCYGNGYVGRSTLNRTRAGRLEWSRASIDEEHGWFNYREQLPGGGAVSRWTWRGEIDCEKATLTTITHTSTTEVKPTTLSGRETSTSSITANPVISTKGSPTSTSYSSASTIISPDSSTAASSISNTSIISARVTLTVNEESNDLVPTLHSSRGVTVSVESCMRDCYGPTWEFSTPPDTAVKFTGFLQRVYCPLKTCSDSFRLSAQYPVDGVILSVAIIRLDDGDRLRANLACYGNGYIGRPTLNGTRVEAGRLEWSRASIDEEHGWFNYREQLVGGTVRWTWKGKIDCEESILTTTTHTSPTEAKPTTVSGSVTTTDTYSTAASPASNTIDYRIPSPQPERQRSLVSLAALAAVPVLVGVVVVSIFDRKRSLTKASQSSATRNGVSQPGIYENTSAGRPDLDTVQYENIAANKLDDGQPQDQSDDRTGTYASLSDERNEGHEYSSLTVNDPTAIYYNIR